MQLEWLVRSILVSYIHAPRGTRTPNLLIRSQKKREMSRELLSPMRGVASLRGLFFQAGMSAIALLLALSPAHAQDTAATGVVRGRVVGPDGSSIDDAVVDLLGLGRARTDSDGAFRFSGVPGGTFILQATKIGFRPTLKMIVVRPNEELRVRVSLDRSALELERVIVHSDSADGSPADPGGFDFRRRGRLGTFITSEQIEARHAIETAQLFQAIAGVEVDRNGNVGIARGASSINVGCGAARVFVDGVPMQPGFRVNDVAIASIRAIEIYRGPATTPMQFRSSGTACGTVAIWTK